MRNWKLYAAALAGVLLVFSCGKLFNNIIPKEPVYTDFSGTWKAAKIHYIYAGDATNPAVDTTVTLPATIYDSIAGGQLDAYVQLSNDMLVGYQYYLGDSIYSKVSIPLQTSDQQTYVVAPDTMSAILDSAGTNAVTKFQMTGSDLMNVTTAHFTKGPFSGKTYTTETTYQKLAGNFPPAGWPATMVETY